MTNPDTPAPAVEAMIARLREPTNVCGACGQPWTGDKCGQVDNSWGFPTCYPHNEINLEEAADMLAALVNDRDRLAKNLDHWRTEVGKLHSKVDRLTADRDRLAGELAEARKWAKDAIFFDSEYVKAVDERANEIVAENAVLIADRDRLRAALTPFAEVAAGTGWDALQSRELIHAIGPRLTSGCYIEAGAFRRARAALNQQEA